VPDGMASFVANLEEILKSDEAGTRELPMLISAKAAL